MTSRPPHTDDGGEADHTGQIGRSVPEWRGDHPDQAIPERVRLRIWQRCGGRCALTGKKLRPGDAYEFDHILALALGGEHREFNLQLVSSEAHKAKTRTDVAAKAKADRIAKKHLGLWPKAKSKLSGRGFAPGRNKAHALSKT